MIPKVNTGDIDRLKASADIIEEVDALNTYLGFCRSGTTDEAALEWSILKIVQTQEIFPVITRTLWATGYCAFNLAWSDRATYTYTYKKF